MYIWYGGIALSVIIHIICSTIFFFTSQAVVKEDGTIAMNSDSYIRLEKIKNAMQPLKDSLDSSVTHSEHKVRRKNYLKVDICMVQS